MGTSRPSPDAGREQAWVWTQLRTKGGGDSLSTLKALRQPLSWDGSHVSGARPWPRAGALPSGAGAGRISGSTDLPPDSALTFFPATLVCSLGWGPGILSSETGASQGGWRGSARNSCSPYLLEAGLDCTGCPIAHSPLLDYKLTPTFNGLGENQTVKWQGQIIGLQNFRSLDGKECGDKVDGSL